MRILTTLAVKGVLDEARPHIAALCVTPMELVLDPTVVMLRRIRSGERGDIAILTAQGVEELIADTHLLAVGRVDLAHSLVGIAVKAGAPKPDISTVAALTRTLREARSLVYSRGGASGIYFAGLLDRLGLRAMVDAKATIIPAGFTAEPVARGEADLAIQQISELMTVPGVDIVGPLPPKAQENLLFSGAIFAGSSMAPQARSVLEFLASAAMAPVFQSKGLLPVNT
jgi:molybdate transport system substrate-binding protein